MNHDDRELEFMGKQLRSALPPWNDPELKVDLWPRMLRRLEEWPVTFGWFEIDSGGSGRSHVRDFSRIAPGNVVPPVTENINEEPHLSTRIHGRHPTADLVLVACAGGFPAQSFHAGRSCLAGERNRLSHGDCAEPLGALERVIHVAWVAPTYF